METSSHVFVIINNKRHGKSFECEESFSVFSIRIVLFCFVYLHFVFIVSSINAIYEQTHSVVTSEQTQKRLQLSCCFEWISLCLSIILFLLLFIFMPVYLTVCLSICLYECLSFCLYFLFDNFLARSLINSFCIVF